MSTLGERLEGLVVELRTEADELARNSAGVGVAASHRALADRLAAALVAEGQESPNEESFTQGVLFAANFLEREADANFMPNEPAKVLLKGMASALRINMKASGFAAALVAEGQGAPDEKPFFWAIETAGGDWHDGEYCVFGDLHSAKDRVDDLNEELPEAEWYRVVPLYRLAAVPSLHKEPHKFPEYPHDDPTVLAIERGYRKWEEESDCHEIGCGCVTVWIWRELAALHKEGAGGGPKEIDLVRAVLCAHQTAYAKAHNGEGRSMMEAENIAIGYASVELAKLLKQGRE